MAFIVSLQGCTTSTHGFQEIADKVSKQYKQKVEFVDSIRYGKGKEVAKFRLSNGLKVIILSDLSSPVLSYQTWFGVGSRLERPKKTGIAHLFEHMMFKGTKAYPHEVFDRLLEEAGAQTNASTWLDFTNYYENLPKEKLELAVKLEADRMVGLILTQEQLDSEREVVKNERRLRVENDPYGQMEEILWATIFKDHPYGRPTLGTMEDLDNLTLEDCISFYKTYYSPGNATVVVVGGVRVRDALKTIVRYYGNIPYVEIPKETTYQISEQNEKRVRHLSLPLASENIKIGFPTVSINHPDAYALDVTGEILFGNESSRLYKTLIEEMRLASEVSGEAFALKLAGVFLIDIVMNAGIPAEKGIDVTIDVLDRLARDGPTKAELERAKNHAEATLLRVLVSVSSRASYIGLYEVVAGDYRKLFSFVDDIRRITEEDIKRVTRKYLTSARMSCVVGKPLAEK